MEEWHRLRSHVLMDAGELGSRNLSVTWLEVPAGAEQTLRSHEEAEQVYVVVRGAGTMSVAGDTQRVERGRPDPGPARDRSLDRQRRRGRRSPASRCSGRRRLPRAELYSDQLAEVAVLDLSACFVISGARQLWYKAPRVWCEKAPQRRPSRSGIVCVRAC